MRCLIVLIGFLGYFNTAVYAETLACEGVHEISEGKSYQESLADIFNELENSEKEINRLIIQISNKYVEQDEFLVALDSSQAAWIKSRDANLHLIYPDEDKVFNYGSVYRLCSAVYFLEENKKRITFLQEWLTSPVEGETCSGSRS